jgi:hypothetical protein
MGGSGQIRVLGSEESASRNSLRRLSNRTVRKKNRSERKRTTQPGHGARIQRRRRNEQISLTIRQAADLKGGGPRYLDLLPLLLKSLIANLLASVVLRRSSHHPALFNRTLASMRRRKISAWFLWLMRAEVCAMITCRLCAAVSRSSAR